MLKKLLSCLIIVFALGCTAGHYQTGIKYPPKHRDIKAEKKEQPCECIIAPPPMYGNEIVKNNSTDYLTNSTL